MLPVTSLVNGNYKDNPNSSVFKIDLKNIIYGSGDDAERTTMTAPDIIGHEYMRYVIDSLTNLSIFRESGALNKSFADIFGEVLELQCYGENDWIFGKQVMKNKSGIRSLSNPKDKDMQYQLPDTYLGQHWVVENDTSGIHINNGVQNYWFYLLANGGAGTNDNGLSYDVEGIGIEKATKITFTNLLYNLEVKDTTYKDVMIKSINTAKYLYGEKSNEVQQTIKAWQAVGLFNPITWEITNPKVICTGIGNETLFKFDLNIDSLGYDISGDGLNFTLSSPEEFEIFRIDSIYSPLKKSEVKVETTQQEIRISIDRENTVAQKNKSNANFISSKSTILSVIGCIVVIDIQGEGEGEGEGGCLEALSINISGGTKVSNVDTIQFKTDTLQLTNDNSSTSFSTFREMDFTLNNSLYTTLKLSHKTCNSLGALEIEILNDIEDNNYAYNYLLYGEDDNMIDAKIAMHLSKYQFYNLDEGNYQLHITDNANRSSVKNFSIKYMAEINGSTCCPQNLELPPNEVYGVFNALNTISLDSGTIIKHGSLEICD